MAKKPITIQIDPKLILKVSQSAKKNNVPIQQEYAQLIKDGYLYRDLIIK